jgi:hypothetical protein
MATTSNSTVLTTSEAKIILDWDNGIWYVSDNNYKGGNAVTQTPGTAVSTSTSSTGGVKVPEWDSGYKYNVNDIVAFTGVVYVSRQNQNQNNSPSSGNFWWNNIIDLSAVDAITLEGKNVDDIAKDILGGNVIGDYYKKKEVDGILVQTANEINAKKLNDWSLLDIQTEYKKLVNTAKTESITYTNDYLHDSGDNSFDMSLVAEFNKSILSDDVNKS